MIIILMLIVMKCQNFWISKLCKSFQQGVLSLLERSLEHMPGIRPVSGKDSTRSIFRNNFEIDRRISYRFASGIVGHVRLYISSESLCHGGIPACII
jgi:hypothetical protein